MEKYAGVYSKKKGGGVFTTRSNCRDRERGNKCTLTTWGKTAKAGNEETLKNLTTGAVGEGESRAFK